MLFKGTIYCDLRQLIHDTLLTDVDLACVPSAPYRLARAHSAKGETVCGVLQRFTTCTRTCWNIATVCLVSLVGRDKPRSSSAQLLPHAYRRQSAVQGASCAMRRVGFCLQGFSVSHSQSPLPYPTNTHTHIKKPVTGSTTKRVDKDSSVYRRI